jgi:DNA-binding FadR family transcriptional regulator
VSNRQHAVILDAITLRDGRLARRLSEEHVHCAHDLLIELRLGRLEQ